MTTLRSDALTGVQRPQILHLPPNVHSLDAATEAIELADAVGMTLDESQRFTLECWLGEQPNGLWSAFEIADIEPRQNGKGDTIQARELAGLFVFGEKLQIHTAHEFPTANEAFLRMVNVIDANPDLSRKVQKIRYANGEQGIELRGGARLKYRARTGGAGRGFAGADLVVLDEAYALQAEHLAALMPTLSTSVNPQLLIASSAGLSTSTALWALRIRALKGDAGRLAYLEHTAEKVQCVDGRIVSAPIEDVSDRRLWAMANPAYGVRITDEYVQSELDAMGPEKFARERLGVFDPLPAKDSAVAKMPADAWASTVSDVAPEFGGREIVIAFAASIDSQWSSIAIAGRDLTAPYVELIEHRKGVGWLPQRLKELTETWDPIAVGCNGAGPSAAQVGPILASGIKSITQLSMADYKAACAGILADVVEGRLSRPDGQQALDAAMADAIDRQLGDGWAWNARGSAVPISPVEAVTVARALLPISADKPIFAY